MIMSQSGRQEQYYLPGKLRASVRSALTGYNTRDLDPRRARVKLRSIIARWQNSRGLTAREGKSLLDPGDKHVRSFRTAYSTESALANVSSASPLEFLVAGHSRPLPDYPSLDVACPAFRNNQKTGNDLLRFRAWNRLLSN